MSSAVMEVTNCLYTSPPIGKPQYVCWR